jgi:hypothetical protein
MLLLAVQQLSHHRSGPDPHNGHLLVDVMLPTCLHASGLHSKDCLICTNTRQEQVCAEPFPVSTSLSNTAHVHHWAQCDVDSLADMLFSHHNTTCTD